MSRFLWNKYVLSCVKKKKILGITSVLKKTFFLEIVPGNLSTVHADFCVPNLCSEAFWIWNTAFLFTSKNL
jgi:hypothetical protein